MGPATHTAGFRRWRRTRPFWGGLGILLGAAVVFAIPFVTLRIGELVVSLSTPGGSAATLVAAVLACCGGAAWWRPEFKTATGIIAMIAALVAVVTTNLGGLVLGSLLAILGAAATLAWTPTPRSPRADPHP
ncbi:DUF6114 domain-containing protein [Actinomycetospora sp. CA-053990]|uniref:DUF6114 domain-containing protein n=1 Tax=Actinomycetospora sp. CA-053990 TaxID=3239891 RepID=UPI003D9000C2